MRNLPPALPRSGDVTLPLRRNNRVMQKRTESFYLIRLCGSLDAERADWFAELSVRPAPQGDTLLSGVLPDQAALLGILLRAHNLNLEIVSVSRGEEGSRMHHGKSGVCGSVLD